MEKELKCVICCELFVKAVTLNCSHSFCQSCIEFWKNMKLNCPICRTKITDVVRTSVLDNLIESMVESLDMEVKQHRQQVLEHRAQSEKAELAIAKTSSTDDIRYQTGTSGGYYGGYGKCFLCKKRGHWAKGCPFK